MEAPGSTKEHAAAGPATETHHSALPEATSRDQKLLFSGRCRIITLLRSRLIRVVTKYYSPMLYLARVPTTAVRRNPPTSGLTDDGEKGLMSHPASGPNHRTQSLENPHRRCPFRARTGHAAPARRSQLGVLTGRGSPAGIVASLITPIRGRAARPLMPAGAAKYCSPLTSRGDFASSAQNS